MGFDPLTLGIAAAGASAGLSVAASHQRNQAIEQARKVEEHTASRQAEAQRESIRRQFEQFEGAVRASAASRGVGQLGSSAALQTSATGEFLTTINNINATERFGIAQSQANASAQMQNPFFNGIQGGLSGLMLGMNLAYAFGGGATQAAAEPVSGLAGNQPMTGRLSFLFE